MGGLDSQELPELVDTKAGLGGAWIIGGKGVVLGSVAWSVSPVTTIDGAVLRFR